MRFLENFSALVGCLLCGASGFRISVNLEPDRRDDGRPERNIGGKGLPEFFRSGPDWPRRIGLRPRRRAENFGGEVSFCTSLSHHSITSSAATSRPGGMVRPSAFVVLRFTTSSYLAEHPAYHASINLPSRPPPQ
jgi:hypothetical protein